MLLFRSMTLGLLGACVVLLARLPLGRPVVVTPRPLVVTAAPPAEGPALPSIQIVDVGPGVVDVVGLIQLAPDEQVVAIDDRAVPSTLVAGAAIAIHPRRPGAFLDLTVASAVASRRVLVLLH